MTTSTQRETNVTRDMAENILSWRSLVGAAVPPRDPNDDEDEQDEEDDEDETMSRPLFESRTKIGPALARTSTMDDVQREEQQVPMGERADPLRL